MIIRIHRRDNPYVMIDKTAVEDQRLSFRAKGLLLYLLSRPDNWVPHAEHLKQVAKEGRTAIETALKELKEAGYYDRTRERDEETGTFYWVGNVYEAPNLHSTTSRLPGTGKPGNGNPVTGFTTTGQSELISNDYNNTGITSNENPPSTDVPKRSQTKYPKKDYNTVTEAYKRIRNVEPQGAEWKPLQQAIKTMFMSDRTPDQIVACMEALEQSDEEWTANWTLDTVKRKLPDFVAGRLLNGKNEHNQERKDRIRALSDDIEQLNHYIEYGLEAKIAKLTWVENRTIEQEEELHKLRRIKQEKEQQRNKLVEQLKGVN